MDGAFRQEMIDGYSVSGPSLVLGNPMLAGAVLADARVQVGLPMTNRHGLIAGATGTGKTKTLQLLAGQLSDAGVPVFVADVKGDLTGLAAPGDGSNPGVQDRCRTLGWNFAPRAHPVQFLSLSGTLGAQVRASVHSFGPTLLGKILDLNDTQTSILSLVFKYCDDHQLPLLDLPDLSTTLRFLNSDEGKPILEEYGGMSAASVGVLLRALVTLEEEGADTFFGEPAFDVADLMRLTGDGRGVISVLELSDVMARPRLFSTFMLWMLAQLYQVMPEAGDLPKPKLAFFFDEAHLLFDDASDALMQQVELTVRLIRSKGVGIYFVTQAPTDVPSSVLAQLGNRVQHALRAFTPDDADNLRKSARTFPMTAYYDVEKTIQSLGIGEAFVTVLSSKGVPTPLAATRLLPPDSLMGPVSPVDFQAQLAASQLSAKYATTIDRESAHEIIGRQIDAAHAAAAAAAGISPQIGGHADGGTAEGAAEAVRRRSAASAQRAAQQQQLRDAAGRAPTATADDARQMQQQQLRAERDALRQQQQMQRQQAAMARQEARARDRAMTELARGVARGVGGSPRRRRRSAPAEPAGGIIRTVFGTLFGGGH